jgi:hypothetical protein
VTVEWVIGPVNWRLDQRAPFRHYFTRTRHSRIKRDAVGHSDTISPGYKGLLGKGFIQILAQNCSAPQLIAKGRVGHHHRAIKSVNSNDASTKNTSQSRHSIQYYVVYCVPCPRITTVLYVLVTLLACWPTIGRTGVL